MRDTLYVYVDVLALYHYVENDVVWNAIFHSFKVSLSVSISIPKYGARR